MRIAVALLLLAGCDDLWNLEHLEEGPFDPASCPSTYALALWPGSRFRIGDTERTAWTAHDRCSADSTTGVPTHLAVAATRDKLDALVGALTARADVRWWIGAVQPTSATEVGGDWLWLTGEPVAADLWDAPAEPNDGNGIEDIHDEQFAFIEASDAGLLDVNGITLLRFLCECDGRPVSAEAIAAVDQSRQL
jgi:hypothetical protein